ncbi:MAG: rhomboid family intramembrane serine protease [Bdellovibrionales bacterium]|nr:rhomboid family intramembrane serine protease [Bdellovibrionales bacterium]
MQSPQFQLTSPSPFVKKLIFANIGIWVLLQIFLERIILVSVMDQPPLITNYLGLIPQLTIEKFFMWQPITYIFLHAVENPMHILFNMLSLWFFGSELEQRWGSRFFFIYYMVCGIGAGFIYLAGMVIVGLSKGAIPMGYSVPVVGASGAIFGLLLAYGILFGDRMIYFFGAFPIKAKYFVMIIGVVEIFGLLGSGTGSPVANLAHIGGLITGFIFLWFWTRYQQGKWRKQSVARRNLKLVVNRDKNEDPKYWN